MAIGLAPTPPKERTHPSGTGEEPRLPKAQKDADAATVEAAAEAPDISGNGHEPLTPAASSSVHESPQLRWINPAQVDKRLLSAAAFVLPKISAEIKTKIRSAKSPLEVELILRQLRESGELQAHEEEVLREVARHELANITVETEQTPLPEAKEEPDPKELAEVQSEISDPEVDEQAKYALAEADKVRDRLEQDENEVRKKKKINFFSQIKSALVKRWARLRLVFMTRAEHSKRKQYLLSKGFTEAEIHELIGDPPAKATAVEATETEVATEELEIVSEAQPEDLLDTTGRPGPPEKVEVGTVGETVRAKMPEAREKPAEARTLAEKEADIKDEVEQVLSPGGSNIEAMDQKSLIRELAKVRQRAVEELTGAATEALAGGRPVSASGKIAAANEIVMNEFVADMFLDPVNAVEIGTRIIEGVSPTKGGEYSHGDSTRNAIRERILKAYGQYFNEKEMAQLRSDGEKLPYLQRAHLEIDTLVDTLVERNNKMADHMRHYYLGVFGENRDQTIASLVKEGNEHLDSLSPTERYEAEQRGLQAQKEFALTQMFSELAGATDEDGNPVEINKEQITGVISELADNPSVRVEITAAGPALIMEQSQIQQLFAVIYGKEFGPGEAVPAGAVIGNVDRLIIASDSSTMHELGHQVKQALEAAQAEARAKILSRRLVLDYFRSIHRSELNIPETAKTDAEKAAKLKALDELNRVASEQMKSHPQLQDFLAEARRYLVTPDYMADTDHTQRLEQDVRLFSEHITDRGGSRRAERAKRLHEALSEPPHLEEIGSALYMRPITERLTMAEIGINPEKLGAEGVITEHEIVAGMTVKAINGIHDKLLELKTRVELGEEDEETYLELFTKYKKARVSMAILLEQNGTRTVDHLPGFLTRLKRRYPELFEGINMPTVDSIDPQSGETTYSGSAEDLFSIREDFNTALKNLDSQFEDGDVSKNDYETRRRSLEEGFNEQIREMIGEDNIGDQSQHLKILIDKNGNIMTRYQGHYSANMVKYLRSDLNPGKTLQRNKVNLWHSMIGTKSIPHEDTRGGALFFLKGFWNPLDILGITPYKMNEAFGAYGMGAFKKVLGKRLGSKVGGIFFTEQLGADPIGKGLPGGLGTLPILKDLRKRLFIAPHQDVRAKLTSPHARDTVEQHSQSIAYELQQSGRSSSETLIILEAIGGFEQDVTSGRFVAGWQGFKEIDEHRQNPVLAQLGGFPASITTSLTGDTLLGEGVSDAFDGESRLRKGQMSDSLKGDIIEMIDPKERDATKYDIADEKKSISDAFALIADAMMREDKSTFSDNNIPGDHFTLYELLDRMKRLEYGHGPESTVPEGSPDGKGTWPNIDVRIGHGNEALYVDTEIVKDFIRHMFKAKAKRIMEVGVYGFDIAYRRDDEGKPFRDDQGSPVPAQEWLDNLSPYPKDSKNQDIKLPRLDRAALASLERDGYTTVTDDKGKSVVVIRRETFGPRGRMIRYFQGEYSKTASIKKKTPQGFFIDYPPVPGVSAAELAHLFGFELTDTGQLARDDDGNLIKTKEKGTIDGNIDGEIANKKLALDLFFRYQERLQQMDEFANVAKYKKKLWGWLAKVNKILRWTIYTSVILGFAHVSVPFLGLQFASMLPSLGGPLVGIFAWDWMFSRFLDRSRDGWGARSKIADETLGKLQGMRSVFEQARAGQALSSDNIAMLFTHMGAIDAQWEGTMPAYNDVVKYSENLTQRTSKDFWELGKQFIALP
ncbi:MAG: hypothetical protein ACE5DX_01105 [Candidatus Dojkabacteria bacterium]